MKILSMRLITLLLLIGFGSACSKKGSGGEPVKKPPTNLEVYATISNDGSGNVNFTATANNAVLYDFEFGDGLIASVASGITMHQYTLAGTNTFTVNVTAKSSDGLTLKKSVEVAVTVSAGVAVLAWSDEFNTDGAPDPAKWGYDLGAGGWGNAEMQYYTNRPENVIVSGGVLKIKAIKESYSGSSYTSARLLSKDKYAFKYGKVEARAKLPVGGGTWPAIWMLGSDINTVPWPGCGEIDIMEHLGNQQNKIYGTLHYPGRSGGTADGSTKTITNASTEFHKYSLEWTAAFIKISVDDVVFPVVANSNAIPFNKNFFFILNVAMGGNFGGVIDPAFNNSTMEIDYIRVYR
jgi:beta-glucanase (GH16 family)